MHRRHTFSVDDFMRMGELGLFNDQRLELLDGIIHDRGLPSPHRASTTDKLAQRFVLCFAHRAHVRVQTPITLGDEAWMPVPDIALVKLGDYSSRHPAPEDILLLVEVSSTTLKTALGVRLEKYAEVGIAECWIADLSTREWVVHRESAPGRYRSITRLNFDEAVAPQAFPNDSQVWLA